MKIEPKTLVLSREDVIEVKKKFWITALGVNDFKVPDKEIRTSNIIIFIDDGGQTKILKNRFGNEGIVI